MTPAGKEPAAFLFVAQHLRHGGPRVGGTIPRFRCDKLMYLAWRRFLPLSLNYLMFFVGDSYLIFLCYNVLNSVYKLTVGPKAQSV